MFAHYGLKSILLLIVFCKGRSSLRLGAGLSSRYCVGAVNATKIAANRWYGLIVLIIVMYCYWYLASGTNAAGVLGDAWTRGEGASIRSLLLSRAFAPYIVRCPSGACLPYEYGISSSLARAHIAYVET